VEEEMYYKLIMHPTDKIDTTIIDSRQYIDEDFSGINLWYERRDIFCREVLQENYMTYLNNCGKESKIVAFVSSSVSVEDKATTNNLNKYLKTLFPNSKIEYDNNVYVISKPINPRIISYCAFLFKFMDLFSSENSEKEILFSIITDNSYYKDFDVRFATALFPYAIRFGYLSENFSSYYWTGPRNELVSKLDSIQIKNLIKKVFNKDELESISKTCFYQDGYWTFQNIIKEVIAELKRKEN
jgi:hypothetical protein